MKTTVLLIHLALALRAYSEGGIPLWTNRYSQAANTYDYAGRISVDVNGNVFVTGSSYVFLNPPVSYDIQSADSVIVAYSGGGAPLWTNRYDGPPRGKAKMDSSGNVVVAGYSSNIVGGFDYVTIRYSAAGVPLWTNLYKNLGNVVWNGDFAVDNGGNVFVAPSYYGVGTNSDYTIIKYSGVGAPLWTNRYDGPAHSYDALTALVVDASGNLFVTGTSTGNGSDYDYATIKYSNAGVPLWTNRYNGSGRDYASTIAVDSSGNVVVAGSSSNIVGGFDYVTVRYSAAGVPLWTNRYNGPANGDDFPGAVIINDNGDVFVTGSCLCLGEDIATLAYSSTGVPLWTNRYAGSVFEDFSGPLALDRDGNVFVVVEADGSDYVTLAYSSTGVPLWTNRFDTQFVHDYYDAGGPAAIATDSDGNVFVTGAAGAAADEPFANTYDYVTIKYSTSVRPRLTVRQLNNRVVLKWSTTNATGLTLQSTTNLNPPILWSDSTNTPSRVGNQFTVTNTSTVVAQFFRLK